MSERCSVRSCERKSHALCHGCKENFCREHMFEHSLTTHLQLNPLIDQVNYMNNQLNGFSLPEFLRVTYQNLEEWRIKAHQVIDMYYTEKIEEIEQFVNGKIKQHQNELRDLQTQLVACADEQETTHEQINLLTFHTQNLQRDVNKILENNFQLDIKPFVFDQNLISLHQSFDLVAMPAVYRVIDRNDESFTTLATDQHYLLLHHEGTLLIVDADLTTYKQTPWSAGQIYDMCYSSALRRFIIINENEVFLLNESDMKVNKVRSIPWQQWFSCTCSESCLYLSTKVYGSAIVQFKLSPSITFLKRWESPEICSEDEAIDGIVYNDQKLALMISNDVEKNVRIDLRSTSTLHRLWTLSLDTVYNTKQAYRFCVINQNEWLVADHHDSRLLHITRDGMIKTASTYHPAPCCAMQFGQDMLAMSTKTVVNLHKL